MFLLYMVIKYTHVKKKRLDIEMINFLFDYTLETNWKNYQETEKGKDFPFCREEIRVYPDTIIYYQLSRCFIRFFVISR